MTRVAILTPTFSSADAVSNDVLAMQQLLSARGHEVSIFADHSNLATHSIKPTRSALSYLSGDKDVLIYHHSIGWQPGIEILKTASCRKIIKYHNVTPPEFFTGVSEQHRTLCENGRSQLREIVECRPDLYLAASEFNRKDLISAGSEEQKTAVVPPFSQGDHLQAAEADLEIFDRYNDGSVNLLTVGGVRPNKGHAALIEAFATYCYHFNTRARLFIVGAENQDFAPYTAQLRQLIQSYFIDSRIVFTGAVSENELKAYYLLASALLITSEHEGFCVPLVEAMAMKVPIIAYASSAIPETANESALIWDERDPYLMAQSVEFLLSDEAARMALLLRGSQRYEQRFSNLAINKQLLEVTTQAGFQF